MTAPVQDQEIQLGDGTVLAVRTTRPPASMAPRGSAVLVHGLASNARMWDACAAAAAGAGLTCVAPDLRGHGRSPALAAAAAGLSPAQAFGFFEIAIPAMVLIIYPLIDLFR